MTSYKVYAFDGTDYTDISNEVKSNVNIEHLNINPDLSLILTNHTITTVDDLTSTGTGDLADGKIVAYSVNQGTEKKVWYGFVERSYRDKVSRLYHYEIHHIFEKLKDKTTTDIYDIVHSAKYNGRVARDVTTAIYSGASVIAWNDITLKELYSALLETSANFGGLANTITWSLGTDMTTIFENYRICSLMLRWLGTDYSDNDLTVGEEDLINAYDFLIDVSKMLGVRIYYTDTAAITIDAQDTAPAIHAYTEANAFRWVDTEKKSELQKKVVLKQNILVFKDYRTSDLERDVDYYFTPIMYGLPKFWIIGIETNGENLDIDLYANHKIPEANTTWLQKFYIRGILETDLIWGESITHLETFSIDKFSIKNKTIQETRYLQTNVGDVFSISKILGDTYISDNNTAEITTSIAHGLDVSQKNIIVGGFSSWFFSTFYTDEYTYNDSGAGIGYPAAPNTYNIDTTTNTIKITSEKYPEYTKRETRTATNDGTVTEELAGTTGTPKYIRDAYADISQITGGGNSQQVVGIDVIGHGIIAGEDDEVRITGLSDSIDGSYTENNDSDLVAGEYFRVNADIICILYDSQQTVLPATINPIMPKYENSQTIQTKGREETSKKWTDYLVMYRPNYSTTAGDWKNDWKVIDMQNATYNLLMNQSIYSPWWYYYFSQFFQTYKTETLSVNDDEAITLPKARKIAYNVENRSIDIIQDSINE